MNTSGPLSDLFSPSSKHWDYVRLKDLLYTREDGASQFGKPDQYRVFNKMGPFTLNRNIHLPTLLDCLRTRAVFSRREVQDTLHDHEQAHLKFFTKLMKLASTRNLCLLSSLYLSLLDSCEKDTSSDLDFNYNAARHVQELVLDDLNVTQDLQLTEPFNVLSQKLERDPVQLEPATYNEFVNCLEITELLGRRNTSVLEVFSYWRNKCESLLISPVSHQTAMTTLIRALMLTKGLGYLVSELKPMCFSNPPDVRRLLNDLPKNGWIKIAKFIGCENDVIRTICNKHSDSPSQVCMFLRWLKMPDCGENDNIAIFDELKRKCGIVDIIPANFPGHRSVREWVGQQQQQTMIQYNVYVMNHTSGEAGPIPRLPVSGELGFGDWPWSVPQHDRGSVTYHSVQVGENNDNGLPYEDSQFDQLSVASESDEVQSSIQSSLTSGGSDLVSQSSVGIQRQLSEPSSEVLQACIDKDWALALTLLKSVSEERVHAFLEAEDHYGRSPLHYACIETKLKLATEMIARGAKVSHVDKNGTSILQYQTVLTNYPLLKELVTVFSENDLNVDMPNRDGTRSPLLMACRIGALKAVELLIRNGANPNGQNSLASRPVIEASARGFIKIIRHLIDQYSVDINAQDKEGNTALLKACLSLEWESVRFLLGSEGIDVQLENKDGNTPLFAAVHGGHLKLVEQLLEKGARINISRRRVIYIKDTQSSNPNATKPVDLEETPLSCACASGYYYIMKVLLLNGANINYICSGSLTALEYAVLCSRRKIVKKLLEEKGLDTSMKALCQPIISAVSLKNYECAKMLMMKLGGHEEAMKKALEMGLNDLLWSITEYQRNDDQSAPSCWMSEEDDLEESSLYNIALYRFCDICVKALCKEGHRKSPKEIGEITQQTAPQLSRFFFKIANDQVERETLKNDFFECHPISPLKYLVQNQYLTYDDFVSFMNTLFEDPKEFLDHLVGWFKKNSAGTNKRPPERADDLLCRLFDTEYFGGRSDSGTSPSSEAANQSQSQDTTSSTSNKGRFDAYKPSFGAHGKQEVKESTRMLSPRERWELKEKERMQKSLGNLLPSSNQRPTQQLPLAQDKRVNTPNPSQSSRSPIIKNRSELPPSPTHDIKQSPTQQTIKHTGSTPVHSQSTVSHENKSRSSLVSPYTKRSPTNQSVKVEKKHADSSFTSKSGSSSSSYGSTVSPGSFVSGQSNAASVKEPAGSQKTTLKSANSHKTSLGHHSDKKRTVLSGNMQELQEHNTTRKKTGLHRSELKCEDKGATSDRQIDSASLQQKRDISVQRSHSDTPPLTEKSEELDISKQPTKSLPSSMRHVQPYQSSSPSLEKRQSSNLILSAASETDSQESPKTSRQSSSHSQASFQGSLDSLMSNQSESAACEARGDSPKPVLCSTEVNIGRGENIDVRLDGVIAGVKAQIRHSIEHNDHGIMQLKITW